jgi:hypothetical protein
LALAFRCRSGSGHSQAGAQSVGQPGDSFGRGESGASAASAAKCAFFELTLSALGRIAPRPRRGFVASHR